MGLAVGIRLADIEANPLGERKLAAEIDGAGDAAHIALPGVRTGFTAPARLLLATKGTANLGARRTNINVDNPTIRSRRRQKMLHLAHIVGKDR